MKKVVILLVVATLIFGGCTSMNATTAERTLAGGAIGASGGALIGWAAGSPAAGAAIGGGAGLLGGYLYDQYKKSRGQ
jgi:NADH:ubiquinone oxidoreductase subunit 2 (subunit N)